MILETANQNTPLAFDWDSAQSETPATLPRPKFDVFLKRSELFNEIYAQHLPIVFKAARSFAYSKEDREDLVQEILISLWEASEHFEARAKLSTYVYLIAYRRALNWKRGRRRYETKLLLFEREQSDVHDGSANIDLEEKIAWINNAIATLRPIDRTICRLFLDGQPYVEIANMLGVTETVVAVRFHRCKQQLIAQLEEDNIFEEAFKCDRFNPVSMRA